MANQEKTAAERYREERKERIAKAAKKNQKKSHHIILTKKSKAAIAVAVVLALVIGIGAFAVSNSGVLERGNVAFTVGDQEVSMAEYSYYYNNCFSQIFYQAYQYDSQYQGMGVMYTGYDYTISPDQQDYTGGEIEGVENPKWTDYFENFAKNQIQYVYACLDYAEENKITLDESDLATVEENVKSFKDSAENNNYSYAAYLRFIYGKAMTPEIIEKICHDQVLATKVSEVTMQEYEDSYTDDKIEEIYNKDLTAYGVVSLRNYIINAETVADEEEGTEATTEKTMAEAKAKAKAFAAKIYDEASFKNAAYELEVIAENKDAENILTDDTITLAKDTSYSELSSESSDEDFLNWAFDKNTAVGSTMVVENANTGYTVYMMAEPVHTAPSEETYDVRHILVKFPEDAEAEAEKVEEEEEEKKEDDYKLELIDFGKDADIDVNLEDVTNPELYDKAQKILKEYLDGDKTEEAFAALAVKYSEDGNAADGGIYEDVTKGYMVSEFEDWAFAEGREKGDVGIVETTYGYHIMYFIETDETTWIDTIKTDLAAEEYNTFADKLTEGENVAISEIQEASINSVEDFTVKFAKTQVRNLQNSAAAAY